MAPRRQVPAPWLKPGVFAGALVPLGGLALKAARGTLGADPVAIALNRLGLLALIFLVASLACTPLKLLLGWTWPIRLRRMLGLFSVFYAALHLVTYVAVDQGFDWRVLWADVTQRKFMIVGFAAFLLLLPLAATSTDAAVRRLGFRRWKALHRLAYLAGALAVVHFLWRVKLDITQPLTYALLVGVLLLVRAVDAVRTRRARAAKAPAPSLSEAG
ncbi:MAG TPA: protein-methionine-sulfoxide reductase heme-binding subunit MsrQ [Myxococcaceae bacterium]|nr:protein-methionine-sulfoxide reductase heme-binding subunit MsrQ [Myxococcaceae bacterium]